MSFNLFGGGGGGGMDAGIMSGILGGDIIAQAQANDRNAHLADHAMDRSDAMARQEMAFQERMSNTAYQRATQDMTKAGINPMVAFQQGGASTPGGAMGQGIAAHVDSPLKNTIASALDAVRVKKELDQAGSQIALNSAQAANANAQAIAASSSAKMTDTQKAALDSNLQRIKEEAENARQKAVQDRKYIPYDSIMNRVHRESGTAKNITGSFNPFSGGSGKETFVDTKTGEILNP